MLLLLTAACADIAFTLGESARATAAETGGDTATDTGGGTSSDTAADTGGETAADTGSGTGADTATETGEVTYGPGLDSVYPMGDVVAVSTAPAADWVSPGDVNGDGLTDLIVSTFTASSWTAGNLAHDFELVLSDGSGGYSVTSVPVGLLGDDPMPSVIGDFDGDGLGDFAVAHGAGISLFRYDGKTLTDRADLPVGTVRVIRSADLDDDGDIDLVGLKSDEAVVWANDGAGGFTELGRVATLNGEAEAGSQSTLRLYDFDTDGILDLFSTGDQWYGVPAQVNLGVGDGTFGAAITSFPDAPYMLDTFVGDYDADGVNEVAYLDAAWLQINIGEWTGTVSSPVEFRGPLYGSSWVVTGDVDADGDADLIGIDGFWASVLQQQSAGMTWRSRFPVIEHELLAGTGNQVFVTGNANDDGCDDLFVYDFPQGYRVALSQASGCAGTEVVDTGSGETGGEETAAADTATDTAADTSVSSFTSGGESRRRHGCSVTDGRAVGAFGVLLAAFASRRRRTG